MAIDFPASPTTGQTFTSGTVTYTWDGTKWTAVAAANSGTFIADTASAGSPSLTFVGDSNTGIYSPGADQVAITSSGSERIRIGATGEIGIGGANYGTSGQVLTSGGSGAAVTWTTPSAGGGDKIEEGNTSAEVIDTGSDGRFVVTTEGSERARVDSAGRLLVGTSTARTNINNSSWGGNVAVNIEGNALYGNAVNIVSNYNGNAYTMLNLCKSNGSAIGSNTLVPSGDVLGMITFQGNDGTEFVQGASIQAVVDTTSGANDMPTRLVFSTTSDGASSPTERMRIDNAGKILAGTTSTLHTENKYFFSNSSTGGGVGVFAIRNTASSTYDNAPGLVVYKTSATTTSNARFVQFYASDASTPMGGIVGNGSSNVQFASISDIRDKENIEPLSGTLDKIKQLEVVSYDWKNSGEHVKAGFIAQNVETVFPEYVVENMASSGEEARKGITGGLSSGYVAVLTAALQEAITRIETLEAKVAALEGV